MRNGVHTKSTRTHVGFIPVVRLLLLVGLASLAILACTAFAQPPGPEEPTSEAQPQIEPQQMRQWQMEGSRDMLGRLLGQLRQKAAQAEQSLQGQMDEPDQATQIRRGELLALRQQIRSLERTLRQLDENQPNVEPPAEPAPPDAERQRLLGNIRRMQTQLGDLNRQLAQVRQQSEGRPDLPPREPRGEEPPQQLAQAGERARDLAERLKEFQRQAEQTQDALNRMEDRESQEARQLRETLDNTHEQIQATQEELKSLEQEVAAYEQHKRQEARRRREIVETHVRDLENRQQELQRSLEAAEEALRRVREQGPPPAREEEVRERLRLREMEAREREMKEMKEMARERDERWVAMQQSLQAMQGRIAESQHQIQALREELDRRAAEQRELAQQRNDLLRQQEELRNHARRMEEQLNAFRERAGNEAAGHGRALDELRNDLQRMGQVLGRVERERADVQTDLKNEVQKLRQQVSELRNELTRTQGVVNMMLNECDRSTVGSAGRTWGW
jgi:chromosome segregation ATPase